MERKFYFASRFLRKPELLFYKNIVESIVSPGFEVVSRWLMLERTHSNLHNISHSELTFWAERDLEDIRKCDTLLHFTQAPKQTYTGGGRHFEAGYALALGKEVVTIGPKESVFSYHERVANYKNFSEYLRDVISGDVWVCMNCKRIGISNVQFLTSTTDCTCESPVWGTIEEAFLDPKRQEEFLRKKMKG